MNGATRLRGMSPQNLSHELEAFTGWTLHEKRGGFMPAFSAERKKTGQCESAASNWLFDLSLFDERVKA